MGVERVAFYTVTTRQVPKHKAARAVLNSYQAIPTVMADDRRQVPLAVVWRTLQPDMLARLLLAKSRIAYFLKVPRCISAARTAWLCTRACAGPRRTPSKGLLSRMAIWRQSQG